MDVSNLFLFICFKYLGNDSSTNETKNGTNQHKRHRNIFLGRNEGRAGGDMNRSELRLSVVTVLCSADKYSPPLSLLVHVENFSEKENWFNFDNIVSVR